MLQKPPAYTGPALLGAEDTIPQTMEMRDVGGAAALGIPAVTEAAISARSKRSRPT